MIATEHGSGNQGNKIYFAECSENAKGGEYSWVSASVKERYTEESRILGRR